MNIIRDNITASINAKMTSLISCGIALVAWTVINAEYAVAGEATDLPAKIPIAREEPHHHVLMENEFVRVYRVVIPRGDATLWHEHQLDFGVAMVNGSMLRGDLPHNTPGPNWMASTANFLYFPFGSKNAVHKFNNIDEVQLNHQLAFELIQRNPTGFAVGDRTNVAGYTQEIDNNRIREWRLKLAPGESAGTVTQRAPGLRFIISGSRFTETHGEDAETENKVASGDWQYLPGAAIRTITNVDNVPLEMIEIEIK